MKWFKKTPPPKPPAQPQLFWEWFSANAERIKKTDFRRNMRPIKEIGHMLRTHAHVEAFQITPPDDEGRLTLEISAEGMKDYVPAVRACVASAPEIPGWKVVAFRQRHPDPTNISYRYEGQSLSLKDVRYILEEQDGKRSLFVTTPGLTKENEQRVSCALYLIVDALLGEEFVMNNLDYVGPIDKYYPGHKYLLELPEELGLPPLPQNNSAGAEGTSTPAQDTPQ